jgi:catalase
MRWAVKKVSTGRLALVCAFAAGAPPAFADGTAAKNEVTVEQVQAALEGAYGVHPGRRRNHAKGTCALGSFVGLPAAAAYSRSSLFSGRKLPVVARFSLGGGDPSGSDTEKGPRGMALEFRLPDGGLQHMTMIDTPMFFAAMPRTFLDKMMALRPDPATGKPDPRAVQAFAASHPDNRGQATFIAERNPPASYTSNAYFGIHTFKFIDRAGKTTLVRWRFAPQDGEKRLSDEEVKSKPASFLEKALVERTARGPVRWDMLLTIGQPGDPEDDPTRAWPADRKELKVGTLTISSAMSDKGGACERINYDPLIMSDGVAPTNDPVLLFRSPSYAESFSRRLAGH